MASLPRISASEFRARTAKNPAWCAALDAALEVNGFCDLAGSNITQLSRFLIFSGRDPGSGRVADFSDCRELESAEGVFHGGVNFSGSGISSISNFVVTQPDKDGRAAQFERTQNLKVAEGIFCGSVNFSDSAITGIGSLVVARPNKIGDAARFSRCANLSIAEGTYPGFVSFSDSSVSRVGCLVITQPGPDGDEVEFDGCTGLDLVEGILPGYVSAAKASIADSATPSPDARPKRRIPLIRPGPGIRSRPDGLRLLLPPGSFQL
jgi:hypothetical protein